MFSQHFISKVDAKMCFIIIISTHLHFIGQEYDTLYISTCEPTDPEGGSLNPTKSLSDLYVFNTTITRARSLIVAFGNPYLLMSTEKHMHLKYNGGHCWSQFIKMCLLHNTLFIEDPLANSTQVDIFKRELMTTIDFFHKTGILQAKGKPVPSHHQQQIAVKDSYLLLTILYHYLHFTLICALFLDTDVLSSNGSSHGETKSAASVSCIEVYAFRQSVLACN